MRGFLRILVLSAVLLLPRAGWAQMHHFAISKADGSALAPADKPAAAPPQADAPASPPARTEDKEDKAPAAGAEKDAGDDAAAAPSYRKGTFSVTPVQDCFEKLGPGETAEVRRNFENPWEECQRRLKDRAGKKKDAEKKDAGKSAVPAKPADKKPAEK